MPLDVLVPGLVPPIDALPEMRGLRVPALEKWLARADLEHSEARSATQWLASAFSLREPAPVAPLSLVAEGEEAEGTWLRADPVHVRIDRERTSLHSAAVLDLARPEADALVAALQGHFASDGFEFRAPAPERWYVRIPSGEMPATMPLDEALTRNVQKVVPSGNGRIKWPAALTEIQMLLAMHEVNAAREREGRPAVNSVWLWGGGELPRHVAAPYATVHSDDPFARGLGSASGSRVTPSPATLAQLSPGAAADWALAMSAAPQRAIERGSAEEWIEAARRLDRDWFDGLGEALSAFGTVRIVLPSAAGTSIAKLTGAARWRVFRGRKALATYA
jgi:hypothetical protein